MCIHASRSASGSSPSGWSKYYAKEFTCSCFEERTLQCYSISSKVCLGHTSGLFRHFMERSCRTTSGVRNAEMKWSNHERLSAYGVRMVGWPEDIPKKNPSVLNSTQNKQLLELAQTGVLGFSRLDGRSVTSSMGEGLWNNPVDDASSPRNAEKSWTNHERRLGAYGALTVSWPDDIPENPSALNPVEFDQTDDSLSVASSMHAEDLVDKTSEEDAQTLDFMNEYICSDGDYAAGSLGDSTISYSMSSRSPDDSGDGGVASAAEGDGDLGSRKRPRYGG
ncbi:hypothetical protein PTI98_009869 [Pleurotus ostreatus]|nr:hypothetical protein PTI98_009869 [Pleurotus ostreatus]